MEPYELLRIIVTVFEKLGIPYFVTGSVASMYYGEPRFTNDIDIVADLQNSQVKSFMMFFPENEFYLSEEAMREAIQYKSMFNIIHPKSGLKIDVSISNHDEFDNSRFIHRRIVEPIAGLQAFFSSPEDVIIKKMLFFREGGSEKHIRDITAILLVSAEELDYDCIEKWVEKFNLHDIWQVILNKVQEKNS